MTRMDVTARDWAALDSWWESHVDPDRSVVVDDTTLALDSQWLTDHWPTLDSWWESHVDPDRSVLVDDDTIALDAGWLDGCWPELDSWWETYREARKENVTELLAELDAADAAWLESPSPFDVDPLSADWRSTQRSTGPIRVSREEDWSYGLAHLLRSADGILIDELFGDAYTGEPDIVETEAHLPGGEEPTRYEDILITYPSGGISIEVKIGDTNLRKTLDTAALIERQHGGDWTHVLLMPEYQRSDLRETFGDELSEPDSGPPVVASDRSAGVQVRYWREVGAALRTLLQRDGDLPPHWVASAYVFCTLIDQRILGLVPRPAAERLSEAADIVRGDTSLSVGIGDIESEIEYLRATTEASQHE